jgi:hypothetical protein
LRSRIGQIRLSLGNPVIQANPHQLLLKGESVGAIEGTIVGGFVALVLLFLWKTLRGDAAKLSPVTPLVDKAKATDWNVRTASLKMAGGAIVAAGIVGFSALSVTAGPNKDGSPRTYGLLVGSVLFAAVTGALIVYCLILRDLVAKRRVRGEHVHPVLRAYFCWGVASLILWCVTLFAAGIGGIILVAAFSSPTAGRAR